MKTTRSIKELLELMLDYEDLFTSGLCGWSMNLCVEELITTSESTILLEYIKINRPVVKWYELSEFYIISKAHSPYFWKEGLLPPRIKWIKRHISINK